MKGWCCRRIGAVALLVGLIVPLSANDHMWTRVEATGVDVTLTWESKHPWLDELRPERVALFAEYRSEGRLVRERIGPGNSVPRQDRRAVYTLPQSLTGQVDGRVCLYFEVGRPPKVLPVRAPASGRETSRWHYPAWSDVVAAASTRRRRETDLALAQQQVASRDYDIRAVQARLAKAAWQSVDACSTITAKVPEMVRPDDVLEPAQHAEGAARACVVNVFRTVAFAEMELDAVRKELARGRIDLGTLADRLRRLFAHAYPLPVVAQAAGSTTVQLPPARRAQLTSFLTDWRKWSADVARHPVSPIGTLYDELAWVSTAREPAFRLMVPDLASRVGVPELARYGSTRPTEDVLTVLAAGLDAYHGCKDDAVKQLATKYESWRTLTTRLPEVEEARAALLRQQCTTAFTALEAARSAYHRAEEALVRVQAQWDALRDPPPMSTRPIHLNDSACVPS